MDYYHHVKIIAFDKFVKSVHQFFDLSFFRIENVNWNAKLIIKSQKIDQPELYTSSTGSFPVAKIFQN